MGDCASREGEKMYQDAATTPRYHHKPSAQRLLHAGQEGHVHTVRWHLPEQDAKAHSDANHVAQASEPSIRNLVPRESKTFFGSYQVDTTMSGILGEGSYAVCRKGVNIYTRDAVAIKSYKTGPESRRADSELTNVACLRRAVEVLQRLADPFEHPADQKLWNSHLDHVKPTELFMQCFDFSRDEDGNAGYNSSGDLFLVTELGQESLKDYIERKREEAVRPSQDTVRSIAKSIVLVMAGLHAKGFIHLDMKPENLMIFSGCLKLIDVDGCIEIGSHISPSNLSISFSPCYCSPEWAGFVVGSSKEMVAAPGLDAWSVGCTICELVTLDAIMKPTYKTIYRSDPSRGQRKYLDWLKGLKQTPMPRVVEQFDPELVQLLADCLLVCQNDERRTCAESLDAPYLRRRSSRTKSNPIKFVFDEDTDDSESS